MKNLSPRYSYVQILRFWFPLATTWLMMSVEGPFIAAIIARLGAEQQNLAAYGVAYAFAMVAESPVIMLMSASTALCRSRDSYLRLRNFSLWLSLSVTLLFGLGLLPQLYHPLIEGLFGMPPDISRLIHSALLCLLPWPGAIGLRRFYQGVLIAAHKTRRVAAATVFRLIFMSGSALCCFFFSSLPGATIGALSLAAGVTAEALLTRFLARHAVAELLGKAPCPAEQPLSYRAISHYYLPLAMTPFIGLSIHPMVTFFLGKSPAAVESLAVMPVIYGLTFIFRAFGLSYQEVAIALLGENRANYQRVRNFAIGLGLFTSGGLSLIAFTPLHHFWFHGVSGLSETLSTFAVLPLQLTAIFPALTVLISFQRSILIVAQHTRPISLATALEAAGIFALLLISVVYFALPGAVAAAAAYVCGRLAAIFVLQRPFARHLKQLLQQGSSPF